MSKHIDALIYAHTTATALAALAHFAQKDADGHRTSLAAIEARLDQLALKLETALSYQAIENAVIQEVQREARN